MRSDAFKSDPARFVIEGEIPANEAERIQLNRIEKAKAALEGREPELIRPSPLKLAKETVQRIRDARAAKREYERLLKQREEFLPKFQELNAEIVGLQAKLDRMQHEGSPMEAAAAVAEDKRLLEAAQDLMSRRFGPHRTWLEGAIRDAAEAAGIPEIQKIKGTIAQDKQIAAERLEHASQSASQLETWLKRVDSTDAELEALEQQIAEEEAEKPGKRMAGPVPEVQAP